MENGWLIVCGVVTFVILVNVGLAISALRGTRSGQAGALDRAVRYIRDPWAAEDTALSELRRQVASLEEEHGTVGEDQS